MEFFVYGALTLQTCLIGFLVVRLSIWRRRAKNPNLTPATFLPPSVLDADPAMPALAARALNRLPRQAKTADLLPDADFDIDAAFSRRIPEASAAPGSLHRRDFADHAANLRARLSGRREIEYLNAIAISYLRRRTARVDHAKTVFFRIWDEKGVELAEELSTRWLISALMTFADYGRSEDERACGALGYLYGSMLVASETERSYWAESASPSMLQLKPDAARFGLSGTFPFDLGDNNHLLNLNAFVYGYALRPSVAGRILEKLMLRVRYSDTYFSRFDDARVRLGLGVEGEEAERNWSFAVRPGGG